MGPVVVSTPTPLVCRVAIAAKSTQSKYISESKLGHTKLMLCLMGYFLSQGDLAGQENENKSSL